MGSESDGAKIIRIAAALIEDGEGRLLLVRKQGTGAFMQAGGKIEADEAPHDALCRELEEELGVALSAGEGIPLGTFTAQAANEPGHLVSAEIFRVSMSGTVVPAAELAEARWVTLAEARELTLAPLTRDKVLPLFESLLRR
ncbi:MAG TPA: NUDIX domain-containing protein [Allosphingosinicella sp.]|uniref:NUDIX hydrolase n=1 Tax=Allosphingosinicella sp. TaxID=2823234 RepID=UPI002ED82108